MENTTYLEDSITTLAELQAQIAVKEDKLNKAEDALMETELGQKVGGLHVAIDELKQKAKELDSQIRDYTVSIFESTGEKHPHPAVGIREYTKLDYDKDEALHWAQRHLPKALKLDNRFFEKHAKAVSETQPISFVRIYKEPRATISTDLGEYVGS